jgi:uncharacterized protein
MNCSATPWLHNRVFWAWLLALIIAQVLKIVLASIRQRRFDFRWLFSTGGMPSSHASSVTSLSTAVGFSAGFDSILFAITVAFTTITLFDAQGFRRSSGRQAQILNQMLEDIYLKRLIPGERVKEFLGHTPVEVFAGMMIGFATAFVIYKWC